MFNRREFLLAAAAASSASAQDSDGLDGESLYKDVVTYHQFGEHRTAAEGDHKTSEWIAGRLKSCGFIVEQQTFTTRQFMPRECSVKVGGQKLRVFPLWPPMPTFNGGVSAPIAKENGPRAQWRNKIVVMRIPFENNGAMNANLKAKILDLASESPAAIVGITDGPTLDIIAFNMEAGAEPWPVPVALAAPRDSFTLERSPWAQLEISGDVQKQAKAQNVIGKTGKGKGKWIVVSTPQSGWFTCAAERGPGIALFLALAGWAKRQQDSRFLFVSTSGHELDGLGMRTFLTSKSAPKVEDVACWLHLGAGIATWDFDELTGEIKEPKQVNPRRYLMSSAAIEPLLTPLFIDLPGLKPRMDVKLGETKIILEAGYAGFGFAARSLYHHTPLDKPDMTGPAILEPVARALVAALGKVAGG